MTSGRAPVPHSTRRVLTLVGGLVLAVVAGGCDDPLLPDETRHYVDVTTGGEHTCAISEEGQAYCWGRGTEGQLGTGSREDSHVPRLVTAETTFESVTAGEAHTCALAGDGRVFCWGWNAHYQLGNIGEIVDAAPNPVSSSVRFTQVSAGAYHTCAVSTDATAYCWGYNRWGQGGNGTSNTMVQPEPVTGALEIATVSAGGSHTCALTTNGDAYCWGANDLGQLGVGVGTLSIPVPTPVISTLRYARVSAGKSHTCAVETGGPAYCWGGNGFGEIGDGAPFRPDLAGPAVPTRVGLLEAVGVLSAGAHVTCATDDTGLGWCWGRNDSGQLGVGSDEHQAFPSPIHLLPTKQSKSDLLRFTKLGAGGRTHTCGLADGSVFCWGAGRRGQLAHPDPVATLPQRIRH